jgi:hypothetical protein
VTKDRQSAWDNYTEYRNSFKTYGTSSIGSLGLLRLGKKQLIVDAIFTGIDYSGLLLISSFLMEPVSVLHSFLLFVLYVFCDHCPNVNKWDRPIIIYQIQPGLPMEFQCSGVSRNCALVDNYTFIGLPNCSFEESRIQKGGLRSSNNHGRAEPG